MAVGVRVWAMLAHKKQKKERKRRYPPERYATESIEQYAPFVSTTPITVWGSRPIGETPGLVQLGIDTGGGMREKSVKWWFGAQRPRLNDQRPFDSGEQFKQQVREEWRQNHPK